jgi:hypothetical protein
MKGVQRDSSQCILTKEIWKMQKRKIVIGALIATAAVTAFTTNIVSVPFQIMHGWLAPATPPTLGSEVRVRMSDRDIIITRAITGTSVEILDTLKK